ncbi:MAG: hypothetical protein OEZ10_10715 [Gammaproteobacteria bacterium]|nr:hypothetical protein [Gammaproteobacteria bacterium]
MKISRNLLVILTLALLPALGHAGLLDAMKQSNWERDTLKNARYDMPKNELWDRLDAFMTNRFKSVNANKNRGTLESAPSIIRAGTTEKQLVYRVQITGREQPFALNISATESLRSLKNGKWGNWRRTSSDALQKQFSKDVYELFHGPLVYDAEKVAAQEKADQDKKDQARREQLQRKSLSSDEWLEQSRKRMQRELNK